MIYDDACVLGCSMVLDMIIMMTMFMNMNDYDDGRLTVMMMTLMMMVITMMSIMNLVLMMMTMMRSTYC